MDIWVTAQECSGLPGLPSAPHNIRANLDKIASEEQRRKREGSKAFEYHYACLPPVARAAVLKTQSAVEVSGQCIQVKQPASSYCREAMWQAWETATNKQRDKARARCEAVIAAAGLLDTGLDTLTAFASVADALKIAPANVQRWYYQARPFDRADWLAVLVSKHGRDRDARKAKEAEITPAAWDFFLGDFMRLEKPSLRTCYYRLEEAAAAHKWAIPSLSSVRRKLEREVPTEHVVLLREGEHALMRLYPAQERSVMDLDAMEWINGDGYKHNVWVNWPNGEMIRPVTWLWQDIRTRKILAWRTDISENSDAIRLSLFDLIEQYGIPRELTIDNTRAAANKWLTGGVPNRYRFKVKDDDPMGIIPSLGINLHWTSVLFGRGHGQAKPIERAFSHGGLGEMVDKHPSLAGAYTGPNPMEKPDYKGRKPKAVDFDTFILALNEGIAAWNRRPNRNTEACQNVLSFDDAFAHSYAQSTIRKATVEQRRLLLLPAEAVSVKQDGTFTMEAGGKIGNRANRYYSEQLIGIKPNKVVVRFDPQALHDSVSCYTLDGRFICDAPCQIPAAFGDTQTGREHSRNRNQFVKETKKATAAQRRMSALEVAELMPTTTQPEPPETQVVELFRPVGNTVRREQVELEPDYSEAFENSVAQLYEQQLKKSI